jgi:thioredoxin-related protein
VRYDADQPAGRALADRFNVRGYPSFVVIDGNGRVIDEFAGYRSASEFVGRLRPLRGG